MKEISLRVEIIFVAIETQRMTCEKKVYIPIHLLFIFWLHREFLNQLVKLQ